ncbi:hypothetical protein [Gordonia crocea]|nr:hypothetical protein [Gordonia crocea]
MSTIADMADSMGAEQAAADLAALTAAIDRAEAAARRVEAVFASTAASLRGAAADAAVAKASRVAADVSRSAAVARSASFGLRGVANTLALTKAKSPALRAAAQELASTDLTSDQVAQVRAVVAEAMNAAYSDPMLATTTPVGDAPGETGYAAAVAPDDASGPDTARADQGDGAIGVPGGTSPSGSSPSVVPAGAAGAPTPTSATTAAPSAASAAPTGGGQSGDPNKSGPSPGGNNPGHGRGDPSGRVPGGVVPVPAGAGRPPGGSGPRPGGTSAVAKPVLRPPRFLGAIPIGPPVGPPAAPLAGTGPRGGVPYAPRASRSEESSDRRAADYLHDQANVEALVGELPLVGPAVIGEPEPLPENETATGTAGSG